MTRTGAIFLVSVLLLAGGCDHATKRLAWDRLEGARVVSLAADTLRFQLTENPGGFMSFGVDLPDGVRRVFFLAIAPLALLAVGVLVLRSTPASLGSLFALGLIGGGGLANWIERLSNGGAVTDFVSFGVGSLRTGIFNLADVFVLAGIALLALRGVGPPPAEEPVPGSDAADGSGTSARVP